MRKLVVMFIASLLAVMFGGVFAASAESGASSTPNRRATTSFTFASVLKIDGKIIVQHKTVTPAGQGPTGQNLHCNIVNNFSDADGSYNVKHDCGSHTAPWGYKISAPLCSTVAGPVNEAGQIWARNGKTQAMQSPHPAYPCDYPFHGTYNPFYDRDNVAYSDVFTWIRTDGRTAQLQYYGHFSISGAPCSPTSC